jgi:hypothetical protein
MWLGQRSTPIDLPAHGSKQPSSATRKLPRNMQCALVRHAQLQHHPGRLPPPPSGKRLDDTPKGMCLLMTTMKAIQHRAAKTLKIKVRKRVEAAKTRKQLQRAKTDAYKAKVRQRVMTAKQKAALKRAQAASAAKRRKR